MFSKDNFTLLDFLNAMKRDGNLQIFYACIEEIKEIAKTEIDSKEFMIVQYMLNGSVDDKNKVLKQILQKISEVKE